MIEFTVVFMCLGFLSGALVFTGYNFFWRRRREGNVAEFRLADLLAFVFSVTVDLAFSPLLSVPGAVPLVLRGLGSGYVFLSSFSFAVMMNFVWLKPLEFLDWVPKIVAGRGHTGFRGFVGRRMAVLSEVPRSVSRRSRRFWVVVLILSVIIVPGAFVYAAVQYTVVISTHGTIMALGVSFYSDSACTVVVSSIDWGALEPGHQCIQTFYMKSTISNVAASVSMAVGNFNPAAGSSYLGLTWDYNGSLSPGQVVPVTFTLSVASTITAISAFSFDICVTATG